MGCPKHPSDTDKLSVLRRHRHRFARAWLLPARWDGGGRALTDDGRLSLSDLKWERVIPFVMGQNDDGTRA